MKKLAVFLAVAAAFSMSPNVFAGPPGPPPGVVGPIGRGGLYVPPPLPHIPTATPIVHPFVPLAGHATIFVPPQMPRNLNHPQPTDLTHQLIPVPPAPPLVGIAGAGIEKINNDLAFKPKQSDAGDYVLIRGDHSAVYEKTSPTTAKLTEGNILVSVRRPSKGAWIDTPDGLIALNTDGDLLISYVGGVLRVDNISCRGTRCKIQLEPSVVEGKKKLQVALAPGYEMVASDHKLLRGELRPPDGIARRGFDYIANGHIGVNEFSVDSMLSSNAIVQSLIASDDKREDRVLHDMCKMAAVLNYVNGDYGFSPSGKAGLAARPGTNTQ